MGNKRLVAIRPYHLKIRERVLAALALAGFDTANALVIPAGTPDDAVLARLRSARRPDGILCPFHAHRDANGNALDGLTTITRIRRELPELRDVPVMMPVSQVALGGVQLRIAGEDAAVMRNIILVPEPELENTAAVAARLTAGGM